MRTTLLLTLLCSFSALWAQVPNGGFENWTHRTVEILDDWNTAGLVQKSTDATDGNSAIRLDTRFATEEFGILTNADISEDLAGGQPYTDIPLVMKFDVKYDLYAGDVAKVLAIFKLDGQPIGSVDFTMNGSTADTFQHISYPIQWATQIQPDSLIVLVTSVDIESPSFNGNGYLIIDNIEFKSFAAVKDSVANRSFENWGDFQIPHPNDWYTTDVYLYDLLGLPVNFGTATQAAHVQSGSASLSLKNIVPEGDIIPGVALTGKSISDIEKPSFPVSRRWLHLQGLYKYLPDNGDKAVIAATFFSNGSLVGVAQLNISDSSRLDEYTYFSTPIGYFGPAIPDSATVIISSADLENPLGASSQLWIDNLSFTDHTASVGIHELVGLQLYPNPMTNKVHIKHMGHPDIHVKVFNTSGQLIHETDEDEIDTQFMPAGLYYFQVEQSGQILLNQRMIKL